MQTINDTIKIIRKEFRRTKEARYIHRLHGVLLVMSGISSVKAGKLLHVPGRTIAYWVKEFNKQGMNSLKDAEKSGRPTRLDTKQQQVLKTTLAKSPKEFGLNGDAWTGALVSAYLFKRHRIRLTVRHCRRILKSLTQ